MIHCAWWSCGKVITHQWNKLATFNFVMNFHGISIIVGNFILNMSQDDPCHADAAQPMNCGNGVTAHTLVTDCQHISPHRKWKQDLGHQTCGKIYLSELGRRLNNLSVYFLPDRKTLHIHDTGKGINYVMGKYLLFCVRII